ncbi:hypothetical protein VTO73DRAFT_7957 [Trametes versicolor]
MCCSSRSGVPFPTLRALRPPGPRAADPTPRAPRAFLWERLGRALARSSPDPASRPQPGANPAFRAPGSQQLYCNAIRIYASSAYLPPAPAFIAPPSGLDRPPTREDARRAPERESGPAPPRLRRLRADPPRRHHAGGPLSVPCPDDAPAICEGVVSTSQHAHPRTDARLGRPGRPARSSAADYAPRRPKLACGTDIWRAIFARIYCGSGVRLLRCARACASASHSTRGPRSV